ncbi:MAG: hypothetical protein OEZ39_12370 [Gammaproteobacteria bacterium]|nr:hypothetical protein [Gammaproteobacteria bacterium]MDH5652640.1 hypothetical protein [Gammaproteobacteria bacterium]
MAPTGTPATPKNFIILLGGPGLFLGCDKAHDQTWRNYLVPIQLAAQRNLYKRQSGEQIHLLVYEPPYKARWTDDSVIDRTELKQDDGYWLHSNRKKDADNIKSKGGLNYLHRIQQVAQNNGMKYVGLKKKEDFWKFIKNLPDNSVSRVWYSGHAAGGGLMLSLQHGSTCGPEADRKDVILVSEIAGNRSLDKKFISGTTQSKFYGCYTETFARKWRDVFKVPAAGAVNKIDFGVIDRASSISNILERIEKTPTTHGPPIWTEHKPVSP